MPLPLSNSQVAAPACLVLMFKAPVRSKRRLAGQIGDYAAAAADRLFDCAVEDLTAWHGPVCFAPADIADAGWLEKRLGPAALVVVQGEGNLGERINQVNGALHRLHLERQLFIGMDCPQLSAAYLAEAERALDDHEVVLGPAADGGAVLMGTSVPWPGLGALPWSESKLLAALTALCRDGGLRVAELAPLPDVDTAADLRAAGSALAGDGRRARRALVAWVEAHADRFAGTVSS